MSVAFVTMVYDDAFFLDLWVRYYSRFTDRRNLYVITHGPQDYAHEIAAGCNIIEVNRRAPYRSMDQDRFQLVNHLCSGLNYMFDWVVYNDVDELLVLDPTLGKDLIGYIEGIDRRTKVVSPLGVEVLHRVDLESDYDPNRPMLSQRKYMRVNAWYCKPCLTQIPLQWGPDGHGSEHETYTLSEDLYLFHLKWFDQQFHIDRHQDRLNMRGTNEDGSALVFGAGSWGWSKFEYQRISNDYLRFTIEKKGKGFDFTQERERLRTSYVKGKTGFYSTDWFVDGDLRILPERFIGLF
ncbi:MAG: glycosyltransferase family 2 protein [Pseudomonadota bacterium]